ncbi:MAG: spermine synthase [Methylococcales bacterium]|nr:spermine synthase [Methylococcales bacterium]
MYKYDGLLIYQSHDDQGIIEVVEQEGVRALHFGSHAQQSSMWLADPDRLHSLYARAMMAGLVFQDNPREVLMIGLGGGTTAKFLLQQFADCRIKAVEFRSAVLKVARSHFGLPFDSRLKVKIGCGAQHVQIQSREHSEQHDLILVDAYDHEGMASEVGGEVFFDDCRTLLTADGLLVINLWGTDRDLFQQVSWNMGRIFNHRVLFLPVRNRGNVIGFAFGEQTPRLDMKQLIDKARWLEQRHHLEFPVYLQDLKRNNPNVLNRLIKT